MIFIVEITLPNDYCDRNYFAKWLFLQKLDCQWFYYNVANNMTVGITLTIISPMETANDKYVTIGIILPSFCIDWFVFTVYQPFGVIWSHNFFKIVGFFFNIIMVW